jgi:hypothetical protein
MPKYAQPILFFFCRPAASTISKPILTTGRKSAERPSDAKPEKPLKPSSRLSSSADIADPCNLTTPSFG